MPKPDQKTLFPLWMFLIALVIRLVPVILMKGMGIGLDDMFQYDMLARSIVAGDGYRWYAEADLNLVQAYLPVDFDMEGYDPRGVLTSFRPPLYPAFLALIYFVTGVGASRFFVARLVQAVMNAALVPLTWYLARRLFPEKKKVAQIAAWVIALYPMLVIYPLALATENLFFVLILCALLALLKSADSLNPAPVNSPIIRNRFIEFLYTSRWFIISGVILGLTALTRSVALSFAGLACLWVWFALRGRKQAVLLFLSVVAITLPWMVRNTLLHHRLTGIESALGYDLYVGYHPQGSGTFQYGISLDLIPMLDDGARDEIGQARALDFIKADPGRVLSLAVRRLGWFFGLERRALTYFYANNFFGYFPPPVLLSIAAVLLLPFMVISASSFFGLALTRWRRETWLMALFLGGYLLPHVLIISEDRFHLALVPVLAILAAHFWVSGLPGLKALWLAPRGRLGIILAGIAVLLLLTNWGLELYRDADKLAQLLSASGNQSYFPY